MADDPELRALKAHRARLAADLAPRDCGRLVPSEPRVGLLHSQIAILDVLIGAEERLDA